MMNITLPTNEEIHGVYQAGKGVLQYLFATVIAQVSHLASHVQELPEVIQQLRVQVQKNSRNSSNKLPSSDGLKKPRTRSLLYFEGKSFHQMEDIDPTLTSMTKQKAIHLFPGRQTRNQRP